MHDCGKAESFIPDWLDIGVQIWEPAQTSNNFVEIKQKYGRDIIVAGAWDNQGYVSYEDTPDEVLRDAVVDYIDRMAPNGGFCFMCLPMGNPGEEIFERKMKLIDEIYEDYGKPWYKNHGFA